MAGDGKGALRKPMTTKKKAPAPQKPDPPKSDPRTIPVITKPDEAAESAIARAFVRPTIQAAVSIFDINKCRETSVAELHNELTAQAQQIHGGDMKQAETMLIAQAHTLDALFNSLTRSAIVSDTLNQYDTKFRLALRAQAQCRATLETLSAIKNPPVIFAKQANITSGPQQVNNGTHTRTGENENEPNKQLQHNPGERLDFRAQGATGSVNPNVEAVGTFQRA